jgi:hypothetical protein
MTKNYNKKLTADINKRLAEVIARICNNPCIYVSESDVQLLVARELMKIPRFNPDKRLYSTNCTIGKQNQKKTESIARYKTMLMHREYGHGCISKARSDLVILSKDSLSKITDPISLKNGNQWLKPDYIFEFGTEKSASSETTFKKHLKNDLKKVAEAAECGYLIHIHRNYQRSIGKKMIKNKEKYDRYLEVLGEVIDGFLNSKSWHDFTNIKILLIVIDIGGDGRVVKSKIRMLIQPYSRTTNLQYTNISLTQVKTNIYEILNLTP